MFEDYLNTTIASDLMDNMCAMRGFVSSKGSPCDEEEKESHHVMYSPYPMKPKSRSRMSVQEEAPFDEPLATFEQGSFSDESTATTEDDDSSSSSIFQSLDEPIQRSGAKREMRRRRRSSISTASTQQTMDSTITLERTNRSIHSETSHSMTRTPFRSRSRRHKTVMKQLSDDPVNSKGSFSTPENRANSELILSNLHQTENMMDEYTNVIDEYLSSRPATQSNDDYVDEEKKQESFEELWSYEDITKRNEAAIKYWDGLVEFSIQGIQWGTKGSTYPEIDHVNKPSQTTIRTKESHRRSSRKGRKRASVAPSQEAPLCQQPSDTTALTATTSKLTKGSKNSFGHSFFRTIRRRRARPSIFRIEVVRHKIRASVKKVTSLVVSPFNGRRLHNSPSSYLQIKTEEPNSLRRSLNIYKERIRQQRAQRHQRRRRQQRPQRLLRRQQRRQRRQQQRQERRQQRRFRWEGDTEAESVSTKDLDFEISDSDCSIRGVDFLDPDMDDLKFLDF